MKWQTAGGDNGTFSNFISTNNLSNGIYFDNGVYDHKFTGVLGVGNNGAVDCEMSHTSQGLIDLNCTSTGADGSTSYPGETTAGSNAILRPSRNLSNAFVGKAPSDAIIPIDTSGTASFTSINADFLYWVGFENPFRAWGKFHADAPLTANHRGHCVTGQTCQIWDYSAVSGQPIYNVSGNGSSTNSAFVADAACPSVLNGNNALVSRMGTYTYLAAAVEILGDKQGNKNGLCESNENCLYTPHFGSYQGSGAPNKCTFNNGTVTNVKMFGLSSL